MKISIEGSKVQIALDSAYFFLLSSIVPILEIYYTPEMKGMLLWKYCIKYLSVTSNVRNP
ncbi:hypothetical protein [Clostridium beijerinckii]|uniref:hypothetical protein n=1 Tax=Clostridium beijerinckii TaxID=1520 RepID=UPI0022E85784|nr:hypothetical protein [Clostridium beijerinckii]